MSSDGSRRSNISLTTSSARALPIRRWKYPKEKNLERMLSLTLQATDSGFESILPHVDKTAKSDAAEDQIFGDAQQLALWSAIKETMVGQELYSLAFTDDLTGLYNRRGFLALARQQLKLAHRNAQDSLLFFCDLDDLKGINDSYGHREGDLALIRVGQALKQTFRDSDILARFGGDEFVVLALEAPSANQDLILHRIQESLEKSNANEPRYKLSLSVGVARFDSKCTTSLDDLVAQADQAMYAQKRSSPYNKP